MSSNPTRERAPQSGRDLARRQRLIRVLVDRMIWWPLLAGISLAWFLFGTRIVRAVGPDALGAPAGVIIATTVAVTLWRWSIRDAHRLSVAGGTCPRCTGPISTFEEQPRPGALDRGLRGWHCNSCGLEEFEPLTPAGDAS